MFSSIKRFICRHRRKIIIGGVVIGGFVFATRFAQRKLQEWQEREMKEFLERTKRQQHFERNERTCNITINSFTQSMCENIGKILDTEAILEKLRNGNCDKVALWEELKVVAFTRLSVLLYSSTLLVVMLRIQLNLIGGYLYRQSVSDSKDVICDINQKLQEDYLLLSRHFLTNGVTDLCKLIEEKVNVVLKDESLKKQLTLQDIERYFWAIQSAISNDPDDPLCNLPKYMLSVENLNQNSCSKDDIMGQIINETLDILATEEVKSLATSSVSRGFSLIMDSITEYFVPKNNDLELAVPGPSTRNDSFQSLKQPNGLVNINKVTIPLAKVIPIVNGLTSVANCNSASKENYEKWIRQFTNIQNLKTLGANVYESFSYPVT